MKFTPLRLLFLALFTFHILLLSAQPHKSRIFLPKGAKYVSGEMIVKVKAAYRGSMSSHSLSLHCVQAAAPNIKITEIKQMFPHHEVSPVARSRSGEPLVDISTVYNIKFDPTISVEDAINAVWTEDVFDFVEPRYINECFLTPNDPLTNNISTGAYTYINAYTAWDLATGAHSIICGIVDTGHKLHADLDGNLVVNAGEIAGNGIDDDANGYIDDVNGWDFAENDNNPYAGGTPHGFTVTQKGFPVTNNALGTPGIAYNSGYRPIRAGTGDISYGYEGIVYAADNGMQVINCSWGSYFYTAYGELIVNYAAINRNAAVVAAAGNTGSEVLYYPASFRRALGVGGVASTGVITAPSTYSYYIDMLSVSDATGYTSGAAPTASAAVTLAYRRFNQILADPTFTPYQAAQRVRVSCQNNYPVNLPALADKWGKGALDLYQSVNDAFISPSMRVKWQQYTITGDGDDEIESGETVNLDMHFQNWLNATGNLTISMAPDAASAPYITMGSSTYNPAIVNKLDSTSNIFSFTLSGATPNDFKFNLKITYTDPVTGYTDFEYITLQANINSTDITNNLFDLTVSGQGHFGFRDLPYNYIGIGVRYNSLANAIYEGGFLIGNSATSVSDNTRNPTTNPDTDFTNNVRISVVPAPSSSDHETNTSFTDATATNPLGVSINFNTYNYNHADDDDYIIFEYLITNTTGATLSNLYAALFADWDIMSDVLDPIAYSKNICSYDATQKMIYAQQSGYSDYYAIALLTDETFLSCAYTGATAVFTDAAKFSAISNVPSAATATVSTPNDIMQYIGAGGISIDAGATHRLAFALIGGNSLTALNASRLQAIKNYFGQIVGKVPDNTAAQSILTGNMEEGDAEGWTHYYNNLASPNRLLFSAKKDNTVSFSAADVEVGYGGSPYYTQITAPTAPYAATYPSNWYVMNRFWDVTPAVQPASPIKVRMYYTDADFATLQTPCAALASHNDLQFYKFVTGSGINPDPLLGHTGANLSDLVALYPSELGSIGVGKRYAELTVSGFSGGGAGDTGDGTPLPVNWLGFEAKQVAPQKIKLDWQTSREVNNAGFVVERSNDKVSFQALSSVPAGNNATSPQAYTAYDYHPIQGENTYRIKQIDIDGRESYSSLQTVLVSGEKSCMIFPNPAHESLYIYYSNNQSVEGVSIYNDLGQKVQETKLREQETLLDIRGLSRGVYHIVISGDETYHYTIIKE